MYLIVGLGNPGKEYEHTRHNVGFDAIEKIASRNNISLNKMKFNSVYGSGMIGNEKVVIAKPQTYMNNSGVAVAEIKNFFKIENKNIIVIVDDIDIDFAKIRIKQKGSAGSHNGLKSIISHLNAQDFPRIKIGVGKKKHPSQDLADFVLSRFDKEEQPDILDAIEKSAIAVEDIINNSILDAMNKYN